MDCHPADRQLKRKFRKHLAVGILHRDGLFLMELASVFEWFAQESWAAAELTLRAVAARSLAQIGRDVGVRRNPVLPRGRGDQRGYRCLPQRRRA